MPGVRNTVAAASSVFGQRGSVGSCFLVQPVMETSPRPLERGRSPFDRDAVNNLPLSILFPLLVERLRLSRYGNEGGCGNYKDQLPEEHVPLSRGQGDVWYRLHFMLVILR